MFEPARPCAAEHRRQLLGSRTPFIRKSRTCPGPRHAAGLHIEVRVAAIWSAEVLTSDEDDEIALIAVPVQLKRCGMAVRLIQPDRESTGTGRHAAQRPPDFTPQAPGAGDRAGSTHLIGGNRPTTKPGNFRRFLTLQPANLAHWNVTMWVKSTRSSTHVGQIAAFFCTNDLRYSDSCPSP